MLHVSPDITVHVLIQRLFDKRGYIYKHFSVKNQSNSEQVSCFKHMIIVRYSRK